MRERERETLQTFVKNLGGGGGGGGGEIHGRKLLAKGWAL